MKPYNAAIVGYGGMGQWQVKGICKTDRVRFTGAYDINPARKAVAHKDGIDTWYESYEALLADPAVDIVLVATPNNFHMEQTCAALEAGKAVVCEKPAAMNSDELRVMMNAATRTGRLLTIHQNRRRDADYVRMRELAEAGSVGRVFSIESRVVGSRGIPDGWRQYAVAGGGMMLDWGVHLIDQMLHMLPGRVLSLRCELYHVRYAECDDGFRLVMKMEDGPAVLLEVGTSHFLPVPRWYVAGDRGALTIPDWDGGGRLVRAKSGGITWEEDIVYTKAGPTRTMAPRAHHTVEETEWDGEGLESDYDGFYRNLADVLDGTAAPLVLPEEALRVTRVMEAAFESAGGDRGVFGPF